MQEFHSRQEDRHRRESDTGANAARSSGNVSPVYSLHLHRYGGYQLCNLIALRTQLTRSDVRDLATSFFYHTFKRDTFLPIVFFCFNLSTIIYIFI